MKNCWLFSLAQWTFHKSLKSTTEKNFFFVLQLNPIRFFFSLLLFNFPFRAKVLFCVYEKLFSHHINHKSEAVLRKEGKVVVTEPGWCRIKKKRNSFSCSTLAKIEQSDDKMSQICLLKSHFRENSVHEMAWKWLSGDFLWPLNFMKQIRCSHWVNFDSLSSEKHHEKDFCIWF